MALLNRFVLVQYDVAGPVLWHERLPLEHLGGEEYMIVTPDRDIYPEELSVLNQDLRGVRVRAARGAVPGGIAAADIYPLPHWSNAELTEIRREAGDLASQERVRRGAAVGGAGVAAGVPAAGHAAPMSPPGNEVAEPYPGGAFKCFWAGGGWSCRCSWQGQQSSAPVGRWHEDLRPVC